MASPDGQRTQGAAQDTIEPSVPAGTFPSQQYLEKQTSSAGSSSGVDAGVDGKDVGPPVEQYGVDPERQSTKVGSLQARSSSEEERGPVAAMFLRHWKKMAQLIIFKLFTASVSPAR